MKSGEYLQLVAIIERLHRQFLEVVKLELDRTGVHDINNVQALLLFAIGPAEMTIGELTLRGAYLGSNVSYKSKRWSTWVILPRSGRQMISARLA